MRKKKPVNLLKVGPGCAGLMLLLRVSLASCAGTEHIAIPEVAPGAPADFPAARYESAEARTFRVDEASSLVEIRAFRGGPFARLGHNHVISSVDVGGLVLLTADPADSQADLYLPVATMVIDDPELRKKAGTKFSSSPSESDIRGTRDNMLGDKLLDAAHYSYVRLGVRGLRGAFPDPVANVELEVRGTIIPRPVSVNVLLRDCSLTAQGELSIRQTDFGVKPFSVLGGVLRVKDEVQVMFRIEARSTSPRCN